MNQVRIAIIGIGGMGKKYAKIIDRGIIRGMTHLQQLHVEARIMPSGQKKI